MCASMYVYMYLCMYASFDIHMHSPHTYPYLHISAHAFSHVPDILGIGSVMVVKRLSYAQGIACRSRGEALITGHTEVRFGRAQEEVFSSACEVQRVLLHSMYVCMSICKYVYIVVLVRLGGQVCFFCVCMSIQQCFSLCVYMIALV
jgi:hypothetical protein